MFEQIDLIATGRLLQEFSHTGDRSSHDGFRFTPTVP